MAPSHVLTMTAHWKGSGLVHRMGPHRLDATHDHSTVATRTGTMGIKHGCLPGAVGRQIGTINIFSTVSPPLLFQKPNPP